VLAALCLDLPLWPCFTTPPASRTPLSAPGNEVATRFGLLHAVGHLIELYRETFENDLFRYAFLQSQRRVAKEVVIKTPDAGLCF
jgi:hypothetical protein